MMRWLSRMGIALACAAWLAATSFVPRTSAAGPTFVQYLPFVGTPDLSRIAYVAAGIGCPCPLGIMYSDGTQISTFYSLPNIGAPAWSPDGTQLIFAGLNAEAQVGIYRMAPDGSGLTRLLLLKTSFPSRIAWSADGQDVAFNDGADIYRMRADGSGLTRLTQGAGANSGPDWSPDGQRIVFASDRQGRWQIYTMNRDGSNQQPLIASQTADSAPEFSPDGTKIAFARTGSTSELATSAIYIANSDGSGEQKVVAGEQGGSFIGSPTWSPDGRRLAYVLSMMIGHFSNIRVVNTDGTDDHGIAGGVAPTWTR